MHVYIFIYIYTTYTIYIYNILTISHYSSIDNESHKLMKRFRDMKDLYDILVTSNLIQNVDGLTFPAKSVLTFESGIDPNSIFIQRRRIDLQVCVCI